MGFDQWVEDTLAQAENVPVLGGFAHDLRIAYIIWREDPVNPQVVHHQANNIDDLHKKGADLVQEFNDSLASLRQHWQSDPDGMAFKYLGPVVTAFQIEHDQEPIRSASNPEIGWQLWQGLRELTALLEYNGAAHHAAGEKLDKIVSLHNQLGDDVRNAAINLGAMTALAFIPGPDLLDLPDAAVEADMVATAVEAGNEVKTVEEITRDTAEIASTIKTGITVTQLIAAGVASGIALVGITLLAIGVIHLLNGSASDNSPQAYGAPPRRVELKDPFEELTETEKQRLKSLRHEFGGMDLEIIALIKAGYSDEDIRGILRNILAWMDKNGIKYDRKDLLFAIPMANSQPVPGKIVFLERGNSSAGWDHILNGTDPVADPGHRENFKDLLGLTSDDAIMWLIMGTLASDEPISVKPDGRGGAIYQFAVAQGVVLYVVIGSNGFIVSAYPRSSF